MENIQEETDGRDSTGQTFEKEDEQVWLETWGTKRVGGTR